MKIAIVGNFVYPYNIDATGKIVNVLAKDLASNGFNVNVFSKSALLKKVEVQNIDGVNYFGIRSLVSVTGNGFRRIKRKSNFFYNFCLNFSFFSAYITRKINKKKFNEHKKFIKTIGKLNSNIEYDLLIICSGNFNLIEIASKNLIKAKKKILYATDDWSLFAENRAIFEESISEVFDIIYTLSGAYDNIKIDKNKFKVIWPLIETDQIKSKFTNKEKRPMGAYFGTLYEERLSNEFFDTISKLSENFNFSFYTHNKKALSKIKSEKINVFDYVDEKEYQQAVANADFLIMIDNKGKIITFLPSKIFEYIGTKKPILFFFYERNTPGYKAMQQYDLVHFINLNEQVDVDAITKFIRDNLRKNSKHELYELFPGCSVQNFTKEMLEDLKWKKSEELD